MKIDMDTVKVAYKPLIEFASILSNPIKLVRELFHERYMPPPMEVKLSNPIRLERTVL